MAESDKGAEIYSLHDAGFKLAETQRELTPIQRFVYAIAKDHHTEDYDADVSKVKRGQRATRGL